MTTKSTPTGRLLIVDDNDAARRSVAEALTACGHETTMSASAAEALRELKATTYDVVITDLQMPGMSGLDLIREIHRRQLPVATLMITAHASISTAVDAMRYGASDYLEKPFNIDALEAIVTRAMQGRIALGSDDKESQEDARLLGNSTAMIHLRELLCRVAPTEATVLVTGESGTGKEVVARWIHAYSRRNSGPFVGLNCPVLSAQLLESELFGHVKGAFTGADDDRIGRFEMASNGTLLLDEVTEIDLSLQPKLLRVLQECSFERVGSSKAITTNARLIATSNRNIAEVISAGRFREDLYYRLAVVPIEVPPLRDRGEDVLLLADHFLLTANERLNAKQQSLDSSARELLLQYNWPGNVRELQNLITRASVMTKSDVVRGEDISQWLQCSDQPIEETPTPAHVGKTIDEMERELITATLDRFDGHRGRTADTLGIAVRTLSGKLRSYGLAPHEKTFSKSA